MIKKSLKSIFCCIFLLYIHNATLFALNNQVISIKGSGEFGIMNGLAKEYVFYDGCKNTDNVLSRLDWDVLMIPYFQTDINVNLFKYLYIDLNGKIAIPMPSGNMQDYDWLNSITAEWKKDDPKELTNYSRHNNEVQRYYEIAFKLGANIPFNDKFTLTPFIGYKYDYIKMCSFGGFLKYKKFNFQEVPMSSGKAISYEQEMNALIVGINACLNFIPKLPIETYVQVIPFVGELLALDVHFARNTAFLDVYDSFFQVEWKSSIFYEINKFNRIGLSSFLQYIPLTKGSTGQNSLGSNGEIPSNFNASEGSLGGTERFFYSFSLTYQFKF